MITSDMIKENDIKYHKLRPDELAPYRGYFLPEALREFQKDKGDYYLYGASAGKYACGSMMAKSDGYDLNIISIFIDPITRGKGIGKRFLEMAKEKAKEAGLTGISCEYTLQTEDIKIMDSLFLSMGGEVDDSDESTVFGMESSHFTDSEIIGRAFCPDFRKPPNVYPFTDISRSKLTELEEGLEIDTYLLPSGQEGRMDKSLSFALANDGLIVAYILGGQTNERDFTLLAAHSKEDAPRSAFMILLLCLINACHYRSGGDFRLFTNAINENSERLVKKISSGDYVTYASHEAYIDLGNYQP